MPRKREPVKYPCTLGDDTDDDMEEEDEDPTLSGELRRNSDDDEDRQSLRTDNDEEEGDQVECGQEEQQQEEENDEDSSGPDSSEEDDAVRAKDRGDGGTPASGSSRGSRSKWSQGSTLASRQRKEWVIISEIPKEGRPTDAIHRELCNMLTHELSKAEYRCPESVRNSGQTFWGGWSHKEVCFNGIFLYCDQWQFFHSVFLLCRRIQQNTGPMLQPCSDVRCDIGAVVWWNAEYWIFRSFGYCSAAGNIGKPVIQLTSQCISRLHKRIKSGMLSVYNR